jgi:hypothetical protein
MRRSSAAFATARRGRVVPHPRDRDPSAGTAASFFVLLNQRSPKALHQQGETPW